MQTFEQLAEYILTHSNHNTNKDTRRVHIIVNYPLIEWDEYAEYLTTLTWFTGIGWRNKGSQSCNVIFAQDLDEALNKADDYDHAMITLTGTFYQNYDRNTPETIHDHFDRFCNSNRPCRGHILWHPNKQYGRLHLQCMFLNLKHWRKIGRPMVGGLYTGKVMLPIVSKNNVHDDYTPFWLKPSNEYTDVVDWHMAEYITKVLEDGHEILNFDRERNCKFFTYPERRKRGMVCEKLEAERNKSSSIVYARNNEWLNKYDDLPPKKYDVIYSPASGEMSEYLWKKFGHENTKLVVFDNHEPSLKWKQMLYNTAYNVNDITNINDFISKKYQCIIDNVDYRSDVVQSNDILFSQQEWIDTIHQVKHIEYLHQDVVKDTIQVDPSKRNLIVLSNIFSYMFLLHKMRLEDIHNNLLKYSTLPNTDVFGKNVFRDPVYYENCRS